MICTEPTEIVVVKAKEKLLQRGLSPIDLKLRFRLVIGLPEDG